MKNDITYKMKVLSSLEKVFPDEEPVYRPECLKLSGLWGETVSFQVAYTGDCPEKEWMKIRVVSDIANYVRVRKVELVPVGRAVNEKYDDYYLRTVSGLYPDLLSDLRDDNIYICSRQWSSLWVDVSLTEEIPAGDYEISIQMLKENQVVCEAQKKITVIGVKLPEQELIHTEWFHADCLADYYGVEVFSERHWTIIENYVREYVARGCNMILTPLFTYSLDTAVGKYRTTTQLVDIEIRDGKYFFGFDRLKRWIDLCKDCGIEYFEMSHLFSQWGAKYAPKVVAKADGKEEIVFGWHTPAVGRYTEFLEAFLPEVTKKLKEWGIADSVFFHVSDEPNDQQVESFRAAKESLGDMLNGFKMIDALSSLEIYRHDLISTPIPSNDEIDRFIEAGLENLWTYYCTVQCCDVANRFISMPSARNRIYGVQLYKYDIKGILHWGYNFYNSQLSHERINPYLVTDAGNAFPGGDPFLVYPGKDGYPVESIRMMVLSEALSDFRAFKLLERLKGKEYVMRLIEGDLEEPVTFKNYPKSDMYLITLRNRVNWEITKILAGGK